VLQRQALDRASTRLRRVAQVGPTPFVPGRSSLRRPPKLFGHLVDRSWSPAGPIYRRAYRYRFGWAAVANRSARRRYVSIQSYPFDRNALEAADQCMKSCDTLGGMCRKVQCSKCGLATWAGCGAHIEQVLGGIPPAQRCPGHFDETRAAALGGIRSWFLKLLSR
jgi:hypothetical protein